MRIGSLFSGVGWLDEGLHRAGVGQTAWFCEAAPYPRRVLSKHWPGVPIYEDVRSMGAWAPIPDVDVVVGGFPCTDISNAGTREGLSGKRSGLWREFARILRMVRPRYVVLENVSAILVRGGVEVLGDLASLGFGCWWDCLPASAFGAAHRRDRWFLVGAMADTHGARLEGSFLRARAGLAGQLDRACEESGSVVYRSRVSDPFGDRDGVSILSRGADGIPNRVDRLRACGNGVDLRVAEAVGRVLMGVHNDRG